MPGFLIEGLKIPQLIQWVTLKINFIKIEGGLGRNLKMNEANAPWLLRPDQDRGRTGYRGIHQMKDLS